jgi:hypothetical protein
MKAYRVVRYSSEAFAALLSEKGHGQSDAIKTKSHVPYFQEYLKEIGASTIVVEEHYIDRDFLEDFAAYYVRCFADYGRTCSRLHFFKARFTDAQFLQILKGEASSDEIAPTYLGFIVVKPLPATIIGRSCLKNYDNTPDRTRCFPVDCRVRVNLFGIELQVRSLPFQEQDTEVAACASSALWSVFHGTGRLFQHAIPSPVEITKAAAAHSRIDDRTIPNSNGLTAWQIADAVRSVGLEPFAARGIDPLTLRLTASAYLRAGIPSLLLTDIVKKVGKKTVPLGQHAVALNGYSFGAGVPVAFQPSQCLFKASTIDRIYCHDDQVGPFAKLRFNSDGSIGTSYPDAKGKIGKIFAQPRNLIVPLYHKIRLPVSVIIETVIRFDAFLELMRGNRFLPVATRLVWDLYLAELNTLRAELFNSALDGASRLSLLQKSLPRYLWCADAIGDDSTRLRLLFDATDLLQGEHIVSVVPFDKQFCAAISLVGQSPHFPKLRGQRIGPILQWFASNAAAFR